MNRQQTAIKNSTVGLISQIITLIFKFWTRSIFVQYLGVEMLGISSTFSSVLNTLSLTELGFQSAVVYSLYKPLYERNYNKVNEIINVLKIIYRCIGYFFILAGILCLPLLKYVLSGVKISITIYFIFIIQVSNSACSYFIAYKRALLHADRKEYITKGIDTAMTIIFSLIEVIVVIYTSNYIYYALLMTLQTIVSNIFVHIISLKKYSFLRKTQFNYAIFRDIFSIVKNLFVAKIAYYIYSSTDNLLISSIVGTASVGYLVNYTTVVSSVKILTKSILSPISPIIGNMLAEKKDSENNERVFRAYTYIRYVIACVAVIPLIVLTQEFICAWIGQDFLLSDIVVWMYGFDLYIHLVHTSLCDFINASGLFREDRNIEIIGAVTNIVISIVLVFRFGIVGVLMGTIVSQGIFWVCRSYVVYNNCFQDVKKGLKKYWLKNVVYFTVFLILSFLMTMIYKRIKADLFVVRFILGGICCEGVICIVQIMIFSKTEEFRYLKNMVMNIVKKKVM